MFIRKRAQKSVIGASAGNAFRHPGQRMLKCCMAEEEWARHCLSLGFALLAPASAMRQCHSALAIEAIVNVVLHVLVESAPLACLTHGYSHAGMHSADAHGRGCSVGARRRPERKTTRRWMAISSCEAVGPFADR